MEEGEGGERRELVQRGERRELGRQGERRELGRQGERRELRRRKGNKRTPPGSVDLYELPG